MPPVKGWDLELSGAAHTARTDPSSERSVHPQDRASAGRAMAVTCPAALARPRPATGPQPRSSPPFLVLSCSASPFLAEITPRLTPSQPISPNSRPYSILGQ